MLALVLVQSLHLYVEERERVYREAGAIVDGGCQVALVVGLHRVPVLLESGIGSERLQPFDAVLEMGDPLGADVAGDERRQPWIAQRDPAPRRHAVGHVQELLRRDAVEVGEHRLLEQLSMQCGDAVDRVAADRRQVRHADRASGVVDD